MKRNTIILIIVILLGAVVVFLASRNSKSSMKKELRDFAIEDTASITKIFMVRKDNAQVLLTREGNRWQVNGKYLVRPDAIDNLLKTLNRVRVKSPVSNSMMENALKMLATRNTKVEVYEGKKLIKTLYVGGPTQDQMGTFMMIEGSSVPFVTHIPGFIGYLSSRFFVEERGWRSTELLRYNFNDIKAVTVENPARPEESFRVENLGNNRYQVSSLSGRTSFTPLDTVGTKFYLSQFEKLNFEFFTDSIPASEKAYVETTPPYRTVLVEDQYGVQRSIKAWPRSGMGKTDVDGNILKWDDERMWGLIDNKDWVVIQYYVFNPIFLKFDDFFVQGRWE
jgi:hypothetical protein